MRALLAKFIDAEGAIGAEAGGHKKSLSVQFIGEVVELGLARQARVVEDDGHDDNENAEVGKNNDKCNSHAEVTEGDEGRNGETDKRQKKNQPKQQRSHAYPQPEYGLRIPCCGLGLD
jgi:hypothetical protein